MLLLAAGHIKFIKSIQLQYSSFLSAKIIQKHTNTYYSGIFKYILFIFILHSKVFSVTYPIHVHSKIYSQYIIN